MPDTNPEALAVALLDANGVPYCGLHEPESTMSDDEKDPRYLTCETCGKRYLTPQHVLNGIILGHLEALTVYVRRKVGDVSAEEAVALLEEIPARFGLTVG